VTVGLFLTQALNGVQLGILLFLLAAGLTLVFGVMNFINLAHGVQYMIGAYLAAMYVAVGLGKTMTPLDILEGRMIVEIGMAAVRPSEFIILRFSHKMAES